MGRRRSHEPPRVGLAARRGDGPAHVADAVGVRRLARRRSSWPRRRRRARRRGSPGSRRSLPATRTGMAPRVHAYSRAAAKSSPGPRTAWVTLPSERLMTSAPWSAAQRIALGDVGLGAPGRALRIASASQSSAQHRWRGPMPGARRPGATPATPSPLPVAAATMPATWVPCPASSAPAPSTQPPGASSWPTQSTMPATLPARSGWSSVDAGVDDGDRSRPSPVAVAHAAGAPMRLEPPLPGEARVVGGRLGAAAGAAGDRCRGEQRRPARATADRPGGRIRTFSPRLPRSRASRRPWARRLTGGAGR